MSEKKAKSLVLVGAGHTHALVMLELRRSLPKDVELTVVEPRAQAVYSGMLPGFVAGHYSRDELNIDVGKLCKSLGANFVRSAAISIDTSSKTVHLRNGDKVRYDIASLDIGITSRMPSLPGFNDFGTPAKPLPAFSQAWEEYRDKTPGARIAIIGGGVAGVELAMAMAFALGTQGKDHRISVIDRGKALSFIPANASRKIKRVLKTQDITLLEDTEISSITSEGVLLGDGQSIEADFIVGAAGATPHPWVNNIGLETIDGYLELNDELQTSNHNIFGAGDCAHFAPNPLPKAGVYAVRQAPVLAHNLLASLSGDDQKAYEPQSDFLKLITLGGQRALAEKWGVSFAGAWAWKLKNRIDQGFMDQFR